MTDHTSNVEIKLKKLKGEYKKEKDRHEDTGEGRTTWEYFDAMDAILGHRPSTRPPIVIDSLDTDTVLSTQSSTQDKEEAEAVEEKNESGSPSSLNSSTTSLPQAGGSAWMQFLDTGLQQDLQL